MTDYLNLALTYGGFTSLDKVYLIQLLAKLTDDQKLAFITPPPSVINAYFAEIYQKESPQTATDYLLDISQALNLFQTQPTFAEEKPFVRLNLSGRSFGFAFENASGLAQVFPENSDEVTDENLLLEIAEIFPHLLVWQEEEKIYLQAKSFPEEGAEKISLANALLTEGYRLADQTIKLSSFNREELLEVKKNFTGQAYYGFGQRESIIYILES